MFVTSTIIGLSIFLFHYGQELVGLLIKEQIAEKSEADYQVDFSGIRIDLFQKKIQIDSLHIYKKADSVSTTDSLISGSRYDILIPKAIVGFGSIQDLYFKKHLNITGIKIFDPRISIVKGEAGGTRSTLSLETGSLYNAISNYLYSFSIKDLQIENASVDYTKNSPDKNLRVLVNEIDFLIKNFKLDSVADLNDSSKFFFTDEIELIITNQVFNLKDSIHSISFDEFHISTKTGNILFKNISLNPRSGVNLDTLDSYFDIDIPEFNFRGLDFGSAYAQNALLLDSVRILNPAIRIYKSKSIKKASEKKQLNLMEMATSVFSEIEIDRLYLDGATINLDIPNKKHQTLYQGKDIYLKLTDVHIDSTHSTLNDLHDIYQYLNLKGTDLFTYIIDSTHTLNINQLSYSSESAGAHLSGVQISPIISSDREITFSMDELILGQMTSVENLTKGEIIADRLEVKRPVLELEIKGARNDSASAQNKFLKTLKINQLKYLDGNISIHHKNSSLLVNHATAQFKGISFTPTDSTTIKFSQLTKEATIRLKDLDISNEQVDLDLHQLDLHDWKTLHAENIQFQSVQMEEPFHFKSVTVTEFDLDHFLSKELLAFDTLIVDEPIMNIFPHEKSAESRKKLVHWAHHTNFKEVKFTNGKITTHTLEGKVLAHMNNVDAELSHFHYDSIKDEYFTSIGYRSDSLYVWMPNIDHTLTGHDLSISIRDSTLDIKRLEIIPQSDSARSQINLASHEFKLRQINFHKLINEQQLHFYTGYILTPKADIKLYREAHQPSPIPKDLLKFGSMNISNGSIHFENHIKDSSLMVDAQHINLLVANFDLGKDSTLFSAKNYIADIRDLSFRHYGKQDSINIDHVFANTKTGNIKVEKLALRPTEKSYATLENINITGLNAEILAHERRIVMDSLIIGQPKIDLDLRGPSNDKQTKGGTLPKISADFFKIDHGHFSMLKDGFNYGKSFSVEDIILTVNALDIDSTTTLTGLTTFLPRTNLSTSNLSLTTPDSLYELSIAGLDYHGPENEIVLHNILLDPLYSRSQFQNQIEYQKDWLDMHIDEVKISNLDYDRAIRDEYFDLKKITILNLNLDTHRDKRLPLEPNIQKPLPQELFMKAPVKFYVDKVEVVDGFVSHSEFSESGTLPGNIFFRDINASIKNISNDRDRLIFNSIMTFESTGVMMNTGKFEVTSDFDLTDDSQFFYFQGTLRDMDLTELNRLLEHTAFVHIRDGYNKYVTFNFEANEDYAIGSMKFYYEDLKIRVLNPDDQSNKGHGASIKSFFANTFVVNKKNPRLLFVREGDIFHHRDGSKAIFNYWAKALLSGVVSSIGAKNNKKEIKKLNNDLKSELDRKRNETLIRANHSRLKE